MWFPVDTATASVQNGVWEIDFPPSNRDREVAWISLKGPPSSSVDVFVDTIFIDTTPRGDRNRADYPKGHPIPAGRQLRLVWNVSTGTAPVASVGYTDGGTELAKALTGNDKLIGA